jgi:hypothetical protein
MISNRDAANLRKRTQGDIVVYATSRELNAQTRTLEFARTGGADLDSHEAQIIKFPKSELILQRLQPSRLGG